MQMHEEYYVFTGPDGWAWCEMFYNEDDTRHHVTAPTPFKKIAAAMIELERMHPDATVDELVAVNEITVSGSRVEINGRTVGKIEWPYEEAQKRVRRSTYKVIMGGRAVGNFATLEEATEVAKAWTPADEIEQEIYERCTR